MGYKVWLVFGLEKLGRDVLGEVKSEWRVPLLVKMSGTGLWLGSWKGLSNFIGR